MLKLTRQELKKRINLGVEWLDNVIPDWYVAIELDRLNMNQPRSCICGQVFSDFWKVIIGGISGRKKGESKYGMSRLEAERRGFYLIGYDRYYDMLTSLWLEKIVVLRRKKL